MTDENELAIPPEWRSAVSRDHWIHQTLVASVYRVEGEFVCSANQIWIEGTYPTFEEAATHALRWANQTWSELQKESTGEPAYDSDKHYDRAATNRERFEREIMARVSDANTNKRRRMDDLDGDNRHRSDRLYGDHDGQSHSHPSKFRRAMNIIARTGMWAVIIIALGIIPGAIGILNIIPH